MALGAKPGPSSDETCGIAYRRFQLVGGFEVLDRSAVRANEVMVMVIREVFGQFVVAEVAVGHDAVHHTDRFEAREVAVDRAHGERRITAADLGDGERTVRGREHSDERFTLSCEALISAREPGAHALA